MAKSSTPYTRNREKYDSMVDPAGNLPPQAVELEEAVLGALMLEKDSVIEIQDILSAEAFYKDTHRIIYEAILGLSHDLQPVDLYTVTERLKHVPCFADSEGGLGGARRIPRPNHRAEVYPTRTYPCIDRDSTPILRREPRRYRPY